jgi:hypothetical protein
MVRNVERSDGGINFYWRIVGIMGSRNPYGLASNVSYPYAYGLASNASYGSFPSSMYGSRVEAAENEMKFSHTGEVPYAPRKSRRGRRSRLTNKERININARYGNLPYGPGGYPLGFQDRNATIGANPRAPVRAPGERGMGYNGDVVPFSGFGGSRHRGKSRRRTTKKQRRKQTRRV